MPVWASLRLLAHAIIQGKHTTLLGSRDMPLGKVLDFYVLLLCVPWAPWLRPTSNQKFLGLIPSWIPVNFPFSLSLPLSLSKAYVKFFPAYTVLCSNYISVCMCKWECPSWASTYSLSSSFQWISYIVDKYFKLSMNILPVTSHKPTSVANKPVYIKQQ